MKPRDPSNSMCSVFEVEKLQLCLQKTCATLNLSKRQSHFFFQIYLTRRLWQVLSFFYSVIAAITSSLQLQTKQEPEYTEGHLRKPAAVCVGWGLTPDEEEHAVPIEALKDDFLLFRVAITLVFPFRGQVMVLYRIRCLSFFEWASNWQVHFLKHTSSCMGEAHSLPFDFRF